MSRWTRSATCPACAPRSVTRCPIALVPGRLVRLARMPLSANGKIDRRALPDPRATAELARAGQPPRSPTEQSLVAIWQDVLQTDPVGVSDDFPALGGHSLKAMQITARVHQLLGVRLALREFFGAPTIAALAALIDAAGRSEAWSHIPPAPPQDHYELSHAQRRLWMLHHMEGATATTCRRPICHPHDDRRGDTEPGAAELIDRHEVLRTAFVPSTANRGSRSATDVGFAVAEFDLRQVRRRSSGPARSRTGTRSNRSI